MKFSGFMRKVSRKVSGRISERLKRKRAAFGIDAAIMIGFLLAMMGALMLFGPQILQWFAGELMGGANGAYALLIELPTWDPSSPSAKPPAGASWAQWVGYVAGSLFPLFQQIGLALLAVVLIIAAMCYIFETFKFVSEGTAMNIILNSVFTLIVIFAIPYIYNGVAAAINAFTGWKDIGGTGLIIQSGDEINTLIQATGGSVLTGGWELVVRFFGSVVLFIIATSILMLAVMMGAVRLLLIGCLAAALPILLMLRLIPPVKHFADSLIETVIGIMFASIIAAVFIHFGYILLVPVEQGGAGITGIVGTAIALATFAGAAYMSTMFAGRLGSLFTTMGGMASTASAMATGLFLGGAAMGAGGAGGAVTGVLQYGRQLVGAGASRWEALRAGVGALGSKAGLKALGAGLGAGLGTTAAAVLPSIITGRGPGTTLQHATTAMPSAIQSAQDAIKNRGGTVAENLLYQFGANKAPGESAHMGLEWYNSAIEGKSDRQVGEYFASKMGLPFEPEKGGREIKKTLASLKENPRLLDRIRLNLEDFSRLPKDERFNAIKTANEEWFENRAAMQMDLGKPLYDPALETLDSDSTFYEKILNHNVLGMPGNVAKARTYSLMRQGYDEGKLSPARGYELYRSIVFEEGGKRRSDKDVGRWVSENLGVHVPEKQLEKLGHDYKDLMEKALRDNPRLLANFAENLEKVKAAGGLRGVSPEDDLKALGENMQWVKDHAAVEPGTDFADFWRVVDDHERVQPRSPTLKPAVKDVFDVDPDRFSSFWRGTGGSAGSSPPTPPSKRKPKAARSEAQPSAPVELSAVKVVESKPRKRQVFDLSKEEDRQKVLDLFHETMEKMKKKEGGQP